jgi:hypothetical protein
LNYFLIVTALVETETGLALLVLPAIPITLLVGLTEPAPEVLLIGPVAGAALLGIGVASWLARNAERSPAQRGLLFGILIYNAAVPVLLGYAGIALNLAGVALWPVVVLHTALAAFSVVVCLATH